MKKTRFPLLVMLSLWFLIPYTANAQNTENTIFVSENFDNSRLLPTGWRASSTQNINIQNDVRYGDSGYSLSITTKEQNEYVITPQINHDVNDIQITLTVRGKKDSNFSILVLPDPTNISTALPIHEEVIELKDEWYEFRINTKDLELDGIVNPAFIIFSNTANTILYVDDIEISSIPNCIRPERVKISNTSNTSADITSIMSNASQYEVQCATEATFQNPIEFKNIPAIPYTLSGLSPKTSYFVRMRGICDADTSEWSTAKTFKTECTPLSGNNLYSVNEFNDSNEVECWTTKYISDPIAEQRNLPNYYEKNWDFSEDYAGTMKLFPGNIGTKTLLISHPVEIDEEKKYDVLFDIFRKDLEYSTYINYNTKLRVWISPTPDIENSEAIPGELINLHYASEPKELTTGWYTYYLNIPLTGKVYIIFEGDGGYDPLHLDNVRITDAPECHPIKGSILYDETSGNEVNLIWRPGTSYQDKWAIRYTMSIGDSIITSKTETTNDTTFKFSNLNYNSLYTIYGAVAALCSDRDTSEWKEFNINFTTEPEPIKNLPYQESFENPNFPYPGWNSKIISGTVSLFKQYSPWGHSGDGGLLFNLFGNVDNVTELSTPSFDFEKGKSYQISLWFYHNYNAEFANPEEGVSVWINDERQTKDGEELLYICRDGLSSINVTEPGWYRYIIDIPANRYGKQYIIFKGISKGVTYTPIDDLEVYEKNSCTDLGELAVKDITPNSATIALRDNSFNPSWMIEYGPAGFQLGTGTQLAGNDSIITITGLNDKTAYEVYARRICNDIFSNWKLQSLEFTTPCGPFQVTKENPFFEGFENFSNGSILNNCYIHDSSFRVSSGYAGVKPSNPWGEQVSFAIEPFEGEHMLQRSRCKDYSCIYVPVYLQQGVDYKVSAHFTADNAQNRRGNSKAKIAISLNPDTIYLLNNKYLVNEILLDTSWVEASGSFSVQSDDIYYVLFAMTTANAAESFKAIAMDNLKVEVMGCIAPSKLLNTSITHNSSTVSVTSSASAWEIKVSSKKFDPEKDAADTYNDTLYNKLIKINDLAPRTTYYYSIRTICENDASSWTEVESFTTDCAPYDIPYEETFEKNTHECWTAPKSNTTSSEAYYNMTQVTTFAHSGSKSLNLYNTIASTPLLNVDSITDLTLSGWVRTNADNSSFTIGVMFDNKDISSYAPIADIKIQNRNKWTYFEVPMNRLITDEIYKEEDEAFMAQILGSKYIAIDASQDNVDFYFDDIIISKHPACQVPTEATVMEVTHDSVLLQWYANGNETAWNIKIDNAGNTIIDTVVTENPIMLGGLRSNITYNAQVAAVCDDKTSSSWCSFGAFTTECNTMEIPYTNSFNNVKNEEIPSCWEYGSTFPIEEEHKWTTKNKYLYYDPSNATGTGSKFAEILSPDFNLTNTISATLSLNAKHNIDSLVVRLSTDGGLTYPILIDRIVATNDDINITTADYNNLEYDLTPYCGNFVRIKFAAYHTGHSWKLAYIDNFEIEKYETCVRPESISVKSSTDTTLTILINDNIEGHNQWQYVYGLTTFDHTMAKPITVDKKEFTITGLAPETNYDIYVRSVCSDNDISTWRGPITYRTACPGIVTLPYFESFENMSLVNEGCFKVTDEYGLYISSTENSYSNTQASITDIYSGGNVKNYISDGTQSLIIASYGAPAYLILPQFNLPLNQTVISFTYAYDVVYRATPLYLGVIRGNDVNSFVQLDEYFVSDNKTYVTYDFSNIERRYLTGWNIALRYGPGQSGYAEIGIDNINVRQSSRCPDLLSPNVVSKTATSVTLEVLSPNYKMELAYDIAGTEADSCRHSMIITSSIITIDNLTKATSYNAYVRAICNNDTAAWSQVLTFSTECDIHTLNKGDKYMESFDKYDDLKIPFPPCFTRIVDSKVYGTTYPILSSSKAAGGERSLQLRGNAAVALPEMSIPGYRLKIRFKLYGTGRVYAGLQKDINDNETYVEVNSVGASDIDWTNVEFNMSSKGIEYDYVVLKTNSDDANIYIDNLIIEWAPTFYEPRNLHTTEITHNSTTIQYSLAPDITRLHYVYTPNGTESTDTITVSATNSVLLSGLKSNETYSFAILGEDADGNKTATSYITFRTLSAIAELPFNCDFENSDDNSQWLMLNNPGRQNKFIIGNDPNASKTGKALYISNDDSTYRYTTNTPTVAHAVRRINFSRTGEYLISFSWKSEGEYQGDDYAQLFLADAGTEIVAGETVKGLSSSFNDPLTALESGTSDIEYRLYNQSEWIERNYAVNITRTGERLLVLSWENDYSGGTGIPVTLDNVSITHIACEALDSVKIGTVTYTEAKATIYSHNTVADAKWIVSTSPNGTDTVTSGIATSGTEFTIKDLTPETRYYLLAHSFCDADGESPTVITKEIFTPCRPIELVRGNDITEDFETYNDNDTQFGCWINKPLTRASAYWTVQNVYNGHNREAYSGYNYASLSRHSKTELKCELTLKANKLYEYVVFAKKANTNGFILNIFSEQNGNVNNLFSQSVNNASFAEYSTRFKVAADGDYFIGICADASSVGNTAKNIDIDNIIIREVSNATPLTFTVNNVTDKSATFAWDGNADKFELRLLENSEVSNTYSFTTERTFKAEQLISSANYTAQLRGIITADKDTSNWISVDFKTLCEIATSPYIEDFESLPNYTVPNCWDYTTGSLLTESTKENNWTKYSDGYESYLILDCSTGGADGIADIRTLPIRVTDNTFKLTFDYQMNGMNMFEVFISTDNGESFTDTVLTTKERNTSWLTAYYDLGDYAGKDVIVSFRTNAIRRNNDYIAIDNFRLTCKGNDEIYRDTVCRNDEYNNYGFQIESTKTASSGDYEYRKVIISNDDSKCDYSRILKLHVSFTGGEFNVYDTICEGDVYDNGKFQNLTQNGIYTEIYESSHGCDSIVNLHLYALPANTIKYDTICEGETYTLGTQHITSSGKYVETFSTSSGCTYTITLYLHVQQTEYVTDKTICEKDLPFVWIYGKEKELVSEEGRHEHKFTSTKTGCDSIIVLNLTVIPDTTHISATICTGGEYLFVANNEVYNTAGIYYANLTNSLKCDSVIALHLFVEDIIVGEVDDAVCKGDFYYKNGFVIEEVNNDTIIERLEKSTQGCDSIFRVNLSIIPDIIVDTTIAIKDGESLIFGGNTLTTPGAYTHTFTSETTGCDSIVNLTLIVGTGIDNIYTNSVIIAPNPINAGETTFIVGDWITEETDGLLIEVFNSIGQLVLSEEPTTFPVQLENITTHGVYNIRITTASGIQYFAKLIVK